MSDFLDYKSFGMANLLPKPRSWGEMDPFTRMETLNKLESQVNLLPPTPEQKRPVIDALKPIGGFLQFVAGVLNVPSAMISGAALQIADHKPGFSAQEYLKSIFNFKDQASWSDVIKSVADQSPTKNVWDRKWVQIVAGLALDMILDPLTYVGYGALKTAFKAEDAKKIAKATHNLVLRQLAEHGDEAAARIASKAYRDTLKKALGKGFGFQSPISAKYAKPFRGMNPVVEEMLKKYKTTGVLPVKEAAEKLAPSAIKVGRGFPGIRKAGAVASRAFNPYYNKPQPMVGSMYGMESTIAGASSDIAAGVTRGFKGIDDEAKKLLQIYLENPNEIMYKNPEMAAVAREKAIAVTQFIQDLAERKGEPTYETFKKLRWVNRKFKGEFLDLMKGMKRWQTAKEAGKKVPEVPIKAILTNTKQYFDESSVHYLESILAQTDVGYVNLTTFAGFKGERQPFTEVFKRQFKNLADDQKNFLNARADEARGLLNDWFKTEMARGITYTYMQGYTLGYKGVFDGSREVPAIGPSMASFQYHKKFQSTREAIKYYTKQLIDQRYAKTPEEAYKLLKKGTTPFGKIIDTLDESLYLRGVAHAKAMARKDFIDEAIQWGVKVDNAGGGLGFSPVENIPELAGYIFPDEYAKFMGRALKTVDSDEAIAKLYKLWDKSQNWWKLYATSVNPGFHLRNAQSNVFLGYMHNGESFFNPGIHRMAARATWNKIMRKSTKYEELLGKKVADPFLDKVFAHNKTMRELVEFGSKRDLIRPEFQMAEIMRAGNIKENTTWLKGLGRAINPVGKQNLLADAGQKIGGFIESQARFADFLVTFKRTGDMESAAAEVNKIMVNYRALTQFERNVMRRGIPFYSWMKQNLVNQFIFIFTQPGRYAKVPKIAHAFQEGVENKLPEDLKPKYFKDLWMWQLPIVLPNGTPLFFNPNFPFQDLNKISMNPKEVFRTVLTAASPFLKVPIEMIPKEGYDIFRQQRLEKYPGYRAPVPGILQFAARAVVNKTPTIAEKLGLRNEKGTITTAPKVAKLIENFAPFVNNYARALAATPNKENYDNIFQAVSYLAGVKIKPVDIPSARYYSFRDELQKRKQYWKSAGMI